MPSETVFQELKRYVRFEDRDAANLREFHPHAAPHFERIAREFYERAREHEAAHEVFSGEQQIERLQRSLVSWMHRICLGPHDEAYYRETAKIGSVHVRVGLPQRYMFAAMALIRTELERIADETMGLQARAVREAISRLLDLELAVMLEAYSEHFVARVQRVEQVERQDLSRALARAEHLYVHAVEVARVLIIGLDRKGTIRLFNREAERVTGYARDEVEGRPFAQWLVPEELRKEQAQMVDEAVQGHETPDIVESVVQTRSRKMRDVLWRFAYSPSELADDVVVFAIGQDITEQKVMAERTRQSEKLAAVGTLAAGLAHEIRNPLNGAQLHLSFLQRALGRTGANADTMEAVHVVADEIRRLAGLVNEFLDFARPKPLRKVPVSIFALIDRVADLMRAPAAAAQVEIEKDLPSRDISLSADGFKLEQVLLNLLQNAIEALSPGAGGTIVVRARRQPRAAVLEIEDDGPGLSKPDAPIFDAFFSTKPGGTGLGLAIVHRIVTDHGGTVGVQSRPGSTIFRVTLPVDLAAASNAEDNQAEEDHAGDDRSQEKLTPTRTQHKSLP